MTYRIAVLRDTNVDQPRNLAKSVTRGVSAGLASPPIIGGEGALGPTSPPMPSTLNGRSQDR